VDFVDIVRSDDQQDVRCAFEGSAEKHKAFGVESVHKRSMGRPVVLLFQRQLMIPRGASRACDGEKSWHGVTP
jgi:hypothetical protein